MTEKLIHFVERSGGAYDDPEFWCNAGCGFGNYSDDATKVTCMKCLRLAVEYGHVIAARLSDLEGGTHSSTCAITMGKCICDQFPD